MFNSNASNLPMHNFTSEDLLLYIYGETSREKTELIHTALQSDWNLQEKLELLKASVEDLSTLSFSPSAKTVDRIMKYAEKPVEEMTGAL